MLYTITIQLYGFDKPMVITRKRIDAADYALRKAVYDVIAGNAGLDTLSGHRAMQRANHWYTLHPSATDYYAYTVKHRDDSVTIERSR